VEASVASGSQTFAEDQAEDQRRPAGGHVNDRAAGEVDRFDLRIGIQTPFMKPLTPNPCERAGVNDNHPDADEQQDRTDFMRSAIAPKNQRGGVIANIQIDT